VPIDYLIVIWYTCTMSELDPKAAEGQRTVNNLFRLGLYAFALASVAGGLLIWNDSRQQYIASLPTSTLPPTPIEQIISRSECLPPAGNEGSTLWTDIMALNDPWKLRDVESATVTLPDGRYLEIDDIDNPATEIPVIGLDKGTVTCGKWTERVYSYQSTPLPPGQ